MDKLLQGLKNTTQKAKTTLKDWLSVDEGETSPSVVERAGQTIQDIFKKDVVKPVPQDGKEYISPAVRTPLQKVGDKIRSTETGNILMDAFLGDGTDDYFKGKIDGKEQGFSLLPKQGEGLIEYLLPETTKDDTTRILERYDDLKEKGIGDERATKVAVEDVFKPKAGSMEQFMATKEGKKDDLTDVEKGVLRKKNIMETLGLGLDVIGNTPFGAITKKGGAKVGTKFLEEAGKYTTPEEFTNALNVAYRDSWKGTKSENADELKKAFEGYYFHGTNAGDRIKTEGFKNNGDYFNSGVYFSTTPDVAIDYMKQARSQGGKTPSVFAVNLDNLKLKEISYDQFRDINKGYGEAEDVVAKLKSQKYDGIKVKDGEEVFVWNPQKIKETDTLEDIWKKGTQGATKTEKAGKETVTYKQELDNQDELKRSGMTKLTPAQRAEARKDIEGTFKAVDENKPIAFHWTDSKNADSIVKNGWDHSKTLVQAEDPNQWWLSASQYPDSGGAYGDTLVGVFPKKGETYVIGAGDNSVYDKANKTIDLRGTNAGIETQIFSPEKFEYRILNPDSKELKNYSGYQNLTRTTGAKETVKKEGYKETGELTTKTLKNLEGKTTVSKQYILDATNRPELKQVERDLLRRMLEGEGDVVDVTMFADKVKAELLPLKRVMVGSNYKGASPYANTRARYETITLPKNERGDVKNYSENIYESPIENSAGKVHFSGVYSMGTDPKHYFGHTRIEDMADDQTRRVIEVQSDLYQKGNLERLVTTEGTPKNMQTITAFERFATLGEKNGKTEEEIYNGLRSANPQMMRELDVKTLTEFRDKLKEIREVIKGSEGYNKLAQYNDPTAHFRMIREEMKKASEDGKTVLQFPTGETAMKIEGLGENMTWFDADEVSRIRGEGRGTTANWQEGQLKPENLKVGKEITQTGDKWIITDVLGDGKFKAVSKRNLEALADDMDSTWQEELQNVIDDPEIGVTETFDISGKMDTNNPIYRFYEKDVQRYLKQFGGKPVVDKQGVSWIEVPITKTMAHTPVEAYGAFGGMQVDDEGNLTYDPVMGAFGVLGIAGIKRGEKVLKGKKVEGLESVGDILKRTNKLADKATTKEKVELPLTTLPEKMYHGTSPENADSILKNGWDVSKNKKGFAEAPEAMYLSADTSKAGDHSAGTYGKALLEVTPKKGENLKVVSQEGWYQTLGKSKGGKETAQITANLQKEGYDAIIDPSGEIIVLNPKKFNFKEAGDSSLESVGDILKRTTDGGNGTTKTMGDIFTGEAPSKTRRFTVRTEKLAPESKPFLQGKYQAKSNKNLIEEADNIIAKSRDEAEIIAKTDSSDRGIAVASRLIDMLTKEAKATKDLNAKNRIYNEIADISNETARNLTEAGRAVQAATILGRLTPEGMVRYASKQIQNHNERVAKGTLGDMFGGYGKKLEKIPELTGEEVAWIQREMERIGKITDEIQKAKEFQIFNRKMSERIPSSLYSKIATLWKAGLLTGLKTSGLNIMSNSAHALSEGAKDIPAVLVDKIISLFTGKRTLALTGKGGGRGAREGVAKGWEYLKTGFDERDIGGKLDYEIVNFGKGKVAKLLQKYEEGVFRLIGSQDQPFYYGAKARSLYSQAIAEARNKGLVGEEATKFVNDLVANPTDDMLKYATLDAETAVFQNLTALGTVGRSIQNIPYVGKFILPFAKTPSAVATQLLAYSPLGIVGTLAKYARKGKFDQRLFSQGMGRGLTGTGVMYIGATLYDSGNLALSMPTTEREKKQWELEGKKPNSIKIGDKWVSVAVLGPAGLALLVGGAYRKAYDEAGSVVKGMLQASIGGVKSFGEQTFLKGINQFTNALSDPERYGTPFFSSFIGSWIPTIVADVARATDDYERRSPGLLGKLQSRIPGIREALQPQVDTFGNEIKTPSAVRVMADATRSSDVKPSDNVTKELRRLMDAGYPATPTQVGGRDGYKTLTPSQNTQLLKISGNLEKTRLAKLMQSEAYKKADDELREKAIQRVVDRAKVEARARVIYDAVSGLSKEQRIQRLKEMKDEKLLTKQVFSAYQSIKNNK